MTDDLTRFIQEFNWALLATILAAIIVGAVMLWAKNAVTRRIKYIRFLADKRLAVETVIHRPTAVGSEEGVIIDIQPGRIVVLHGDGRKWLVPPSVLLEHGAVIGGPMPVWWDKEKMRQVVDE